MEAPFPRHSFPAFPAILLIGIALASPLPASAKLPVAVLGAWVEGQDSLYSESLARELGQALADDTALLVYDLRGRHRRRLDSVQAAKGLDQAPELLAALSGGQVRWGLAVECRAERREDDGGDFLCLPAVLSMKDARRIPLDTARFLPEAAGKRKQVGQGLARAFASHFRPQRGEAPAAGGLRLNPPANPALLVRDLQVVRRGHISEVPLGATLVIGDAPGPLVLAGENVHFILYPKSSYTFLLPRLAHLHSGALGLLPNADSTSMAGRLKSIAALDSSNHLWRNLARLAALDSGNLIWRSLGKAASPDSGASLLAAMGPSAALDTTHPILRALRQVAAQDTGSLVWQGLARASARDSADSLWRKLGRFADRRDGAEIWRQLGYLAFQESTVVITPSCVIRGLPQAALLREAGGVTTLDVVRGTMLAHPLLGSQPSATVGAMRSCRTRGFALRQEPLGAARADRILGEFARLDPARGTRGLASFLPGKLFAAGVSLRTPDRPIQAFISGEFRDLDMDVGVLSSDRDGWSDPGTFRPASHEAGCYLCSPDRIGP